MNGHSTEYVILLIRERDEARAENQRLRDALEQIANESNVDTAVNFGDAIRIAHDALAAVREENE